MAEFEETFFRMNKKAELLFLQIPKEFEKTMEWVIRYRDELCEKMKQAREEQYTNAPILPKTPSRHRPKRVKRPAVSTSSDGDDEHTTTKVESNKSTDITDSSVNTTGRSKRNASKMAEQKIHIQSKQTLNSKLRRPGKENALNDISNTSELVIKSEKKSASPIKEPAPQLVITDTKNIKKENMPPPAAKPKKGRKKIKKEVETSDTENECTRVTRSKRTNKAPASIRATSTRSTASKRGDSDVILQEVPVPVISIESDTDDAESQINSEAEYTTESTKVVSAMDSEDERSLKGRKKKTKKGKKPEPKVKEKEAEPKEKEPEKKEKEPEPKEKKPELKEKKAEPKEKKVEEKNAEAKDDSLYEDALPIINKDNEKKCTVLLEKLNTTHIVQKNSLNSTRVIEKCSPNLDKTHVITKETSINCTIVLEKLNETVTVTKSNFVNQNQTVVLSPKEHQWQKPNIPLAASAENLLTDDEESIVKATPEKKPARKGVKTKQMFSPYSNSPVRKRVAAFEKLVEKEPADIPTRVTRTKTRNIEKDKENATQTTTTTSTSTVKTKYFTPTTYNKLPSLIPQSDPKALRQKTSCVPTKSASAVKPSRAEVQLRREEDQKKRLEKEEEAKRKREAIMQAKAEEQRKKREEKQLKVQKAREEMEREKEEKLRQMLQEKDEETQKKKEWQARKFKEIEESKRAEAELIKLRKNREIEKIRQMEEKRKKQLATKPPPLPVDYEDSGSDSENAPSKSNYEKPEWAQSSNLYRTLMQQRCIPKSKIEKLFQMEAQTPDLREIFETVDERILRRNSSAVWRTPPRYSTLPKF